MKTTFAFVLGVILAFEALAESSPPSNAEQMNALRKTIDEAYRIYYTTNDPNGELYETLEKLQKSHLPKMFSLAEKEPESEAACEVFVWIAMKAWDEEGPTLTNRFHSIDYLTKFHSSKTNLGPVCRNLGHYWSWRWNDKPVVTFLEKVAKDNPKREIRGQAIYALGQLFARKSQELAGFENWGKKAFFTNGLSASYLATLAESGTSHDAAAKAEERFKGVIAEYPECTEMNEFRSPKEEAAKLKSLAEQNLFGLQNLSLGKMAPEIEAEDLNGKKFKLSDSRGKICVLSFWASWCGPCMQLVPIERALFERLRGDSFAMIGVNGDAILSNAKRAVAKEKMAWPSFWNGKGGPKGPVSKAWNIAGWPTIYVLDSNGVIRFKTQGFGPNSSKELNGCVDALMDEMAKRNL